MSRLERRAHEELEALDASGLRREVAPPRGIDFASNDYLGLRNDERILRAARDALSNEGFGAGSARLLRGSHPSHCALEERFAKLQGMEDALLFPSGYQANIGVLQALAPKGWRIVSDEHNHASIVEGCRSARAETVVVPHNDLRAFEEAISGEETLVVTESVFSMTGDRAPLEELGEICARKGAALIVDEAHAVGVLPPEGRATLRVNPCGKALAGAGAVVTGPRPVIELLRSTCRSFLYTTAPPPSISAGVLKALEIAEAEPERAQRALQLAKRVLPDARSCIVPVPCRDNAHALQAQAFLQESGLDVRCVRPPTVPRAGLRVSVHADRTDEEIGRLRDALERLP
ncbi:MAG: aminotransferase class I/II-fold pyridoxal phosphate-dependent enzyme [Planctomycetota bacterium]